MNLFNTILVSVTLSTYLQIFTSENDNPGEQITEEQIKILRSISPEKRAMIIKNDACRRRCSDIFNRNCCNPNNFFYRRCCKKVDRDIDECKQKCDQEFYVPDLLQLAIDYSNASKPRAK